MSQEDELFMENVSASIKVIDGHYSIALPLKKKDTEFPNNHCVAEQRTWNLEEVCKRQQILYRIQILYDLNPRQRICS